MRTVPTNMTIADYCQAMQRREITVNQEYQRSDKVWPAAARSYLVETVLLDFPVPKLSLHQKTDVKAKKVVKEIVDGQQRSRALLDFYEDKFPLAKSIETPEWIGLSFSSLNDDLQEKFIDYSLSIDLFTGASDRQVREVFRRMNSYTIPLNDEEQRHAKWQGHFKWFLHKLGQRYDQSLLNMGLFTEKALVRMQDTKLLTEVTRALEFGIETTKRKQLDDMYRLHDDDLPERDEWEFRLTAALDQLVGWTELHRSLLMKPHIVYALLLALIHMRRPVDTLTPLYRSPMLPKFDDGAVLPVLSTYSEALGVADEDRAHLTPAVQAFVAAAAGGRTNVKEQREQRFMAFCRALDTQQDA
jgi:hypothetical protein